MLYVLTSLFSIYLVWSAITIVVFPFVRGCGLRGFQSWLVARSFGPFLFALVCLNLVRWLPVRWNAPVFWIILAAGALVSWRISRRQRPLVNREIKAVLRLEIITILLAAALVMLFGFHYGRAALGERPLDLAFVSRLLVTDTIPPNDFWFAGEKLNIYYFGSWSVAVMGRGAFLRPEQAYFFGLVLVWLMATHSCVFAARVMGLRRIAIAGVPLLVLAMGNGGPLYHLARGGWDSFSEFPLQPLTRIIPYTINENPSVAFWVSELHAHVMGLPLLVLWASLLPMALKRNSDRMFVLCALVAASLAMTDSWLVPPAALFAVWVAVARGVNRLPLTIRALGLMSGIAILASLAFLVGFHPFPLKVRLLAESNTTLGHVAILWGPLILLLLTGLGGTKNARCVVRHPGMIYGLCGIILIVFCELFYLDSQLPPPGERQNTLFRFHYAAWVFLALAVGEFWAHRFRYRSLEIVSWLIIALFVLGGAAPGLASLFSDDARWTADLRRALDPEQSGRIQVAEWIYDHTPPNTIIAESAGKPYRLYATVSALSGRAAVLGETDKIYQHAFKVSEIRKRHLALHAVYQDLPQARKILEHYGVDYIVLGPKEREAFPGTRSDRLIEKYAEVFQSGETKLLKVAR